MANAPAQRLMDEEYQGKSKMPWESFKTMVEVLSDKVLLAAAIDHIVTITIPKRQPGFAFMNLAFTKEFRFHMLPYK